MSALRRIIGNTRIGSLLLEAIVAIGIFGIFLGGIGVALVLGERTTVAAGDYAKASYLAEQSLEAVRQIQSQDFAFVTTGEHGIALGAGGWSFSGTSVLKDGYRTSVTVATKGTDWLEARSSVSWNFGQSRSGSVLLHTYLTNWRKVASVGNWALPTRIANLSESGTPEFQKISISGNYAYVTSTRASGGNGLYVYDITNPAAPVRVSSAFDLGASGYGVFATGNRLLVATDDAANEVQVYDISDPVTLAPGNLINSYDLPGSGKARPITVYGENVFVGTLEDSPNPELTALLMSETGPMSLQGTLAASGSVLDIALLDGYAYLGNALNSAELQVVDIFDPENLVFAPGVGIDLPDVQDALSITTFGTGVLIGRAAGETIDELTLYSTAFSPVPSPPPGPWTLDLGGASNALGNVLGSRYAFVGGDASSAQLRVIDTIKFAQGQAPILFTYNANATVRSLFYDWQKDRLYIVTPSNLMVFAPG